MPDIEAETVASKLEREYFSRFGLPLHIHSDNGKQFVSELVKEVCRLLTIRQTFTPTYSPQSNSVERSHRHLEELLRALMDDLPYEDWEELLYPTLFAMRTTRSRTTGFTPHFLVYGREAQIPVDIAFGRTPDCKYGHVEYANRVYNRLERACNIARTRMNRYIERSRMYYSDNVPKDFMGVGNLCWLFIPKHRPGTSRKLATRWVGPFQVTSVISPVLRRIRSHGDWNSRPPETVVPLARIKPYYKSGYEPEQPVLDLESEELSLADEHVEANPLQDVQNLPRSQIPDTVFVSDSMADVILDVDTPVVVRPSGPTPSSSDKSRPVPAPRSRVRFAPPTEQSSPGQEFSPILDGISPPQSHETDQSSSDPSIIPRSESPHGQYLPSDSSSTPEASDSSGGPPSIPPADLTPEVRPASVAPPVPASRADPVPSTSRGPVTRSQTKKRDRKDASLSTSQESFVVPQYKKFKELKDKMNLRRQGSKRGRPANTPAIPESIPEEMDHTHEDPGKVQDDIDRLLDKKVYKRSGSKKRDASFADLSSHDGTYLSDKERDTADSLSQSDSSTTSVKNSRFWKTKRNFKKFIQKLSPA